MTVTSVFFTKDLEDYLRVRNAISSVGPIVHFHRIGPETPEYSRTIAIDGETARTFPAEFLFACRALVLRKEHQRIVFLGAGDSIVNTAEFDSQESPWVFRNSIIHESVVNRLISTIQRGVAPFVACAEGGLACEFKKDGFDVGYIGSYTFSIEQIGKALHAGFAPTTLWFIVELIACLEAAGIPIVRNRRGCTIQKAGGLDKTVGSNNRELEFARLNLCYSLIRMFRFPLTLIPALQLAKFRLRLSLKYGVRKYLRGRQQ